MKSFAIILFSVLFLTACKKYENDEFISTYSPLKRLTASSDENIYWVLVGYIDEVGNEVAVPSNLYNLRFEASGQLYLQWAPYLLDNYSYVPAERYSSDSEWSFKSNKEKLIFFDEEHDILKLTVTDLELKNRLGAIYTFKKQPIVSINNMEDAVSPIPLLGVIPISTEYHKLVWSNSLNSQSGINLAAQASINGTTNTGPVSCSVQSSTLFGTAYISATTNTTSATCTFSRYFNKPGFLTFFFRKSNGSNFSNDWPQIKVNGFSVEYAYESTPYDNDPNYGWYKAIVPVNITGNISFQITGTQNVANGIDEIRQWEKID